MHLDLTEDSNRIQISELGTIGVHLMIGGFAIELNWDQWSQLLKSSEAFEQSPKDPKTKIRIPIDSWNADHAETKPT